MAYPRSASCPSRRSWPPRSTSPTSGPRSAGPRAGARTPAPTAPGEVVLAEIARRLALGELVRDAMRGELVRDADAQPPETPALVLDLDDLDRAHLAGRGDRSEEHTS